jgi:signal peptidase
MLREIVEIAIYLALGYIIAVGANAGLSYGLNTNYPVVAVVSTSMEHSNVENTFYPWLEQNNISVENARQWRFDKGLHKGDLVVVHGVDFEKIKIGDVIVYRLPGKEPIIHRVVDIEDGALITKGDNNYWADQKNNGIAPPIKEENVQGRAIIHIPLLGWVKIAFLQLIG